MAATWVGGRLFGVQAAGGFRNPGIFPFFAGVASVLCSAEGLEARAVRSRKASAQRMYPNATVATALPGGFSAHTKHWHSSRNPKTLKPSNPQTLKPSNPKP